MLISTNDLIKSANIAREYINEYCDIEEKIDDIWFDLSRFKRCYKPELVKKLNDKLDQKTVDYLDECIKMNIPQDRIGIKNLFIYEVNNKTFKNEFIAKTYLRILNVYYRNR